MSRVAVGSSDGININEHFGQVKEFLIYDVEASGEYTFLETRENSVVCGGSEAHKFGAVLELLADVNAVLVRQIGGEAIGALQEKKIAAVSIDGPIDKALKAFGKRGNILANMLKSIPEGVKLGKGGCGNGRGCGNGNGCGHS